MPEQFRYSVDRLAPLLEEVQGEGIRALLLFGLPESKDEKGSGAWMQEGVVQQALREIKKRAPQLLLIADVCLCEYTSHGHCGLVSGQHILNDESLSLLADTAQSLAEAGADVIAPSDMMDGRVLAIRRRLDETGFAQLPILSYAAKYASGFYGPFREAAQGAPQFGDRTTYQMDCPNRRQAMRELAADLEEGADLLMVKPALAYLDVLQQARQRFDVPLAAYNVSGEYAMVKAAARLGWLNERRVTMEILTAIRRAGADLILTYHARQAARWLAEEQAGRI